MAHKPKIPPSTGAIAPISGQKRAAKDVTPASVGKGRKPKTASRMPELATAVESGHAATEGVDAAVHDAETPARGRQGRMPKQSASPLAAPLLQEDAKKLQGRKSSQPEAKLQPIGG